MKLEFSQRDFEKKKSQISNFIKIRLVRIEWFHADKETDRRTADGRTDKQISRS